MDRNHSLRNLYIHRSRDIMCRDSLLQDNLRSHNLRTAYTRRIPGTVCRDMGEVRGHRNLRTHSRRRRSIRRIWGILCQSSLLLDNLHSHSRHILNTDHNRGITLRGMSGQDSLCMNMGRGGMVHHIRHRPGILLHRTHRVRG